MKAIEEAVSRRSWVCGPDTAVSELIRIFYGTVNELALLRSDRAKWLKDRCDLCGDTGWSQTHDGSGHASDPEPCKKCINVGLAENLVPLKAKLFDTQLALDEAVSEGDHFKAQLTDKGMMATQDEPASITGLQD